MRRNAVLFALTLILLGGLFAQPVLAGTVGYVDFEFLFNNHPEYELKNEELQEAAERLTAEFQAEASALGEDVNLDELASMKPSSTQSLKNCGCLLFLP